MGFSDIFSDFYNSIGFTEVHAEAPPEEEKEDEEGGDDKGEEKSDDGDKEEEGEEGGEEEGGDDEGGDDEEEEEEEEEPEDPKPKLEERKSIASLRIDTPSYLLLLGYSVRRFLLEPSLQTWQAWAPVSVETRGHRFVSHLALCQKPQYEGK